MHFNPSGSICSICSFVFSLDSDRQVDINCSTGIYDQTIVVLAAHCEVDRMCSEASKSVGALKNCLYID